MPYTGNDIKISQNVYVENDIEVDEQGNLSLVSLIYQADIDEPMESRTDFDTVIENLIDYYREDVVPGRNQIYSIASELERSADVLRRSLDENEEPFLYDYYSSDDDELEQDLSDYLE